ncbi:SDR family oxidoreductase [Mesorhizobium sp. MSK_1335]|uniref:SDR family oxidoreductase n=1 Tax=Mesorhizobium montanum TaxID=3072323 RepID=A0ABU4ZJ53_9HYPH|nr:SDR family oxidoreductase [Mesorhizobium sp. MSK_1335]MDX8525393.1 SDR family oxidoreductase [Mesorhizobium sp. MSK_1335]
MIAVTGGTGQLGQRVIDALLKKMAAADIVALVRNPSKAAGLKAQGVTVRQGDYNDPVSLQLAFAGAQKLLLISAGEPAERVRQHENAVRAAKAAGVQLIAYTSILHADTSPVSLAEDHRATEALLKASGAPYVLLRNGWYTENYLEALPIALQHGAFLGCVGDGRLTTATRTDYAEAAAAVMVSDEDQSGITYELAGDQSYTLSDLAAEVARQSGKVVTYRNLSEESYLQALVESRLPVEVAQMLVGFDVAAKQGALFDDSQTLSRLIRRATTSLERAVADALGG